MNNITVMNETKENTLRNEKNTFQKIRKNRKEMKWIKSKTVEKQLKFSHEES